MDRKKKQGGSVFAAEVVTGSKSPQTPVRPTKHIALQSIKHSQDRTPLSLPGEGIKAAMSLPPIPAPEILDPKRKKKGKV